MLEVKNICKSFKINESKYIDILKHVSFKIKNNGLYFIVGKSGCGKSTLLNILESILTPDSGEVLIDGENIFNLKDKEKNNYLKDTIGVVFQYYNLFDSLTVKENILLSEKIKNVNNENYIKELSKKLKIDNLFNQKVATLSGGEKQRVAILRSIISHPKIILCDEPTGALDYESALIIMDILKSLAKDAIIIVVTHNETLVEKYGDGCFLLEDGTIKIKFLKEDKDEKKEIYQKRNYKNNKGFAWFLSKKHLLQDIKINLISIFSIFLTFLIFTLTLSFFNGFSESKGEILDSFINYNMFKISKVISQNYQTSNLEILKKEAPEDEEIKDYIKVESDEMEVFYNLDFFFEVPKKVVYQQNTLENIRFLPYYSNFNLSNFYCNHLFYEMIDELDKNFTVTFEKIYNFHDKENNRLIENKFKLDLNVTITDYINEFIYLNQPTIYYPYFYFLDLLDSVKVENVNNLLGTDYTWKNVLELANNSDEIKSYSKLIRISDENIQNIRNKIKNYDLSIDKLKIESDSYTIVDSFDTLSSTLFLGVKIFLGISALCSVFLTSFISFSSFLKSRKEIAILKILGSSDNEIIKIFIYQEIIVYLLSFAFSIILFLLMMNPINQILFNIFAFKPFLKLDFLSMLLIFLIGMFVIILSTYIPLKLTKKIDISKELKEE